MPVTVCVKALVSLIGVMTMSGSAFTESFDTFDTNLWIVSDFAIGAGFIDTAWSPSNVIVNPGTVELELNSDNARGKN